MSCSYRSLVTGEEKRCDNVPLDGSDYCRQCLEKPGGGCNMVLNELRCGSRCFNNTGYCKKHFSDLETQYYQSKPKNLEKVHRLFH
jgi:hypothetical protein